MYGTTVEELVCKECRKKKVYYDSGYSACKFDSPVRELIHLFKYGKRRYLASFLGGLILEHVRERADVSRCDAIAPVPLHWWRHWRRGFNQSAELSRYLSKRLRIPLIKRNLTRVRHTRPQVGLSPDERNDNIKNAFKVRKPAKIAGKKILLLDDVITSGATLNECARVLKKAGAASVTILTLAHASNDTPIRSDLSLMSPLHP